MFLRRLGSVFKEILLREMAVHKVQSLHIFHADISLYLITSSGDTVDVLNGTEL